MTGTIRPRVRTEGDLQEQVQQYAREHGLQVSEAYRQLINVGLNEQE